MKLLGVSLTLLLLVNTIVLYLYQVRGLTEIIEENQGIENISAAAYLLSAALLLVSAIRKLGLHRLLTLFFGLTCLLLFCREVDLEDLAIPSLIQFLGHGIGRNLFFAATYSLLLFLIWKARSTLLSSLRPIFYSPVSRTVLAGCLLLLIGNLFEKLDLVLWEELLEFSGAILIMIAALAYWARPSWLIPHR